MEHAPKQILSVLALASTGLFALGGINAGLSAPFFAGLGAVAMHYAWQIKALDIENRESCWDLFVSNRLLGLILTFSILAGKHVSHNENP